MKKKYFYNGYTWAFSLSFFFFFAERKRKTCELFFTDYNAAIQHREILYF